MEENSALILMDFSENYASHVQNEARITGPITVVQLIQGCVTTRIRKMNCIKQVFVFLTMNCNMTS